MNDRGLLDLIISLLPSLKTTERVLFLQAFDKEEELFLQSKSDIEGIIQRGLKHFWDISEIREKANRIDMICKMRSIKWVSWRDFDYPPLLREIYDPPCVIFYRGSLPDPEKPLLAMVGTRKPSPEACDLAYKIAFDIGRAGVSVVSGLALGIDAMSHRGNLVSGVPGFAVLGSGVDEIYPSANKPLAKKILDSGGAIISEYPPGRLPNKWTFPERNRIISALSRAVLVVQAPERSGALITANFALEHDKDLWVASLGMGQGFDNRGAEKHVQDGADVIYSAKDIAERWNIEIAANDDGAAVRSGETCRRDYISSMADFLKIEI